MTNRSGSTARPSRACWRIRQSQPRRGERFAVLYVDLDRFKTVNDSLGHLMGDRLLAALAQRLQACLDAGDTVARLGGNEFAILLDNVTGEAAASEVARRIAQYLAPPCQLGGREVHLTTSIGIDLGPSRYGEPDELVRDADIALYQAKAQGKARHVVFHLYQAHGPRGGLGAVAPGAADVPAQRGHCGRAQVPSTGELRQRRTERARRLVLPTVRLL